MTIALQAKPSFVQKNPFNDALLINDPFGILKTVVATQTYSTSPIVDYSKRKVVNTIYLSICENKENKAALKTIEKVLEDSKALLEYENNWDEEGSEGYSLETWNRMASFIKDGFWDYFKYKEFDISVPEILPSSNGSIDLMWEVDKFDLLLNIPKNEKTAISFYGDNKKDADCIKGSLNSRSMKNALFEWIEAKYCDI